MRRFLFGPTSNAPFRAPLTALLVGAVLHSSLATQTPPDSPTPAVDPPSDHAAEQPVLPLAIARPAPDVGLDDWLGSKQKPSKVIGKIVEGGGVRDLDGLGDLDKLLGNEPPGKMSSHHGEVVLVHVIDWDDPVSSGDLLELVRELARANEDRNFQPISIVQKGVAAEASAEGAGLDWPVAMTALNGSSSVYVDLESNGRAHVFLIGRGGELVWRGNPLVQAKPFFAALEQALARAEVARVSRDLGPELDRALEEYFAGRLAKAAALADNVEVSARRASRTALEVDAQFLIDRTRASELAWLRLLRESATRRREFGKFLLHVDALAKAFPRTTGKAAKAREKELSKEGRNLARLKEERQWIEIHAKRPALYPVRRDRAGDRFAKRVSKFLDRAKHAVATKLRAQDLLDRYLGAKK